MSRILYNPAFNAQQMQRNKLNFGSKPTTEAPVKKKPAGTKTGKVIGGLAAYGVLSYPAQKTVISHVLPKFSSSYKNLAAAYKQMPHFINPKNIPIDKLTKCGEEILKLSPKQTVGVGLACTAAAIAIITAGAKLGSLIQKQFQK